MWGVPTTRAPFLRVPGRNIQLERTVKGQPPCNLDVEKGCLESSLLRPDTHRLPLPTLPEDFQIISPLPPQLRLGHKILLIQSIIDKFPRFRVLRVMRKLWYPRYPFFAQCQADVWLGSRLWALNPLVPLE